MAEDGATGTPPYTCEECCTTSPDGVNWLQVERLNSQMLGEKPKWLFCSTLCFTSWTARNARQWLLLAQAYSAVTN